MAPKTDPGAGVGFGWKRGGRDAQMEPEMRPKGPKWRQNGPKGRQNDPKAGKRAEKREVGKRAGFWSHFEKRRARPGGMRVANTNPISIKFDKHLYCIYKAIGLTRACRRGCAVFN